ncbi:hypothetical protein HPB52_005986 [Rhipicephalus sanguineus]|uniref:Uncharacterized protein n=1 Tax=Rhipicephalus sanguineus TaxID=34632 RepID=A0A9D4PVS6_RHISA|nr:hypothetical protein HPB52_005986 [Rhipicephalus sanguineus]
MSMYQIADEFDVSESTVHVAICRVLDFLFHQRTGNSVTGPGGKGADETRLPRRTHSSWNVQLDCRTSSRRATDGCHTRISRPTESEENLACGHGIHRCVRCSSVFPEAFTTQGCCGNASSTKWDFPNAKAEVAHFSHPFELELENTAGTDQEGQRELSLLTWRPLSRSLVSRMRRFFTGGDPPMEDLCVVGPPPGVAAPSGQNGGAPERSKRMSRYSLLTESSGSVKVLLNVVRQTTRQVSESSITAVLASFHRARSRMLAARARHTALAQT